MCCSASVEFRASYRIYGIWVCAGFCALGETRKNVSGPELVPEPEPEPEPETEPR
jgi:hypothetical protein